MLQPAIQGQSERFEITKKKFLTLKAIKKILVKLLLCLVLQPVFSAAASTVVEFSGNDRADKIMTNGAKARIGTGNGDYVLVDYKTQNVKMVLSQQQQILDLGAGTTPTASVSDVKTRLHKIGPGPAVAGYPTTAYAWQANGQNCGTIFASKEALYTPGVQALFNALQWMMEKQRAAMGGYAALMSTCMQANFKLAEHIREVGIPMRMLKPDGQLENEIKSIKTGVALTKALFEIPGTYKPIR